MPWGEENEKDKEPELGSGRGGESIENATGAPVTKGVGPGGQPPRGSGKTGFILEQIEVLIQYLIYSTIPQIFIKCLVQTRPHPRQSKSGLRVMTKLFLF